MKKSLFNLILLIFGTLIVLLLIILLYSWLSFITDSSKEYSSFFDFISKVFAIFFAVIGFSFGTSTIYSGTEVSEILIKFLPHTLILVFTTIIFTAVLSLIYALIIFFSNKETKRFQVFSIIGSAIPAFLLSKIIYIFFNGRIVESDFPKGILWKGLGDAISIGIEVTKWPEIILSYLTYLALPVLILIISDGNLYHFFSMIKKKVQELKSEAVIEYKFSQGYGRLHIYLRHIIPHTLMVLLHQLKFRFVHLISTAAVVETIFRRYGIGYRLIELAKTNTGDINLLLGILYITSLIIILMQQLIIFIENYYVRIIHILHAAGHYLLFKLRYLSEMLQLKKIWRLIIQIIPTKKYAYFFIAAIFMISVYSFYGNEFKMAGSDQRLIKNGYEISKEYQELKSKIAWGNDNNESALLKISKFKYMSYANLMTMDLMVILKASIYSAAIGLISVIIILIIGLPAGIVLGLVRKSRFRNYITSLTIAPFDVVPRFFLLAVLIRIFRFSPLYHSDIAFLSIYILLLSFLHIPEFIKMISIYVEEIRKKSFYIIGEAIGISVWRKVIVYIFHNIRTKIVIESLRIFVSVIFLEAALSYFGFTVPVKGDFYVITLGRVIDKYSTTLNFLTTDWAEIIIKLSPLVAAASVLVLIIVITNAFIQHLIAREAQSWVK